MDDSSVLFWLMVWFGLTLFKEWDRDTSRRPNILDVWARDKNRKWANHMTQRVFGLTWRRTRTQVQKSKGTFRPSNKASASSHCGTVAPSCAPFPETQVNLLVSTSHGLLKYRYHPKFSIYNRNFWLCCSIYYFYKANYKSLPPPPKKIFLVTLLHGSVVIAT